MNLFRVGLGNLLAVLLSSFIQPLGIVIGTFLVLYFGFYGLVGFILYFIALVVVLVASWIWRYQTWRKVAMGSINDFIDDAFESYISYALFAGFSLWAIIVIFYANPNEINHGGGDILLIIVPFYLLLCGFTVPMSRKKFKKLTEARTPHDLQGSVVQQSNPGSNIVH